MRKKVFVTAIGAGSDAPRLRRDCCSQPHLHSESRASMDSATERQLRALFAGSSIALLAQAPPPQGGAARILALLVNESGIGVTD